MYVTLHVLLKQLLLFYQLKVFYQLLVNVFYQLLLLKQLLFTSIET